MKLIKFTGAALASAMLTAMLSAVTAAAANDAYDGKTSNGNYGYILKENGTITVDCLNSQLETAEVPAQIDGYAVTGLADGCFDDCEFLTEISLPDGLVEIGDAAFYDCIKLTEITLPETVTTIGSDAFSGCTALSEITIPESVTEIRSYAFDSTEGMTAFHVAQGNPNYTAIDGVLFDKACTTLLRYPEAKADASYTVPAACRSIADWAFIGAKNLEAIDLANVQTIGEDAFYYCVGLKSVVIPEGVEELVGAAFCYCVGLEEIKLPSTLKKIGENCFYSCTALTEVRLPHGLQQIDSYAFFHCTSLKKINIPKTVETISGYCIGYFYDEESEGRGVQENLTVQVTKQTAGYTYASGNDLTYEFVSGIPAQTIVTCVIIAVVIAAAAVMGFIMLKRKRR